jgi:hypothetical protein
MSIEKEPVIETYSYAWALREAFLAAALRHPFFADGGFTVRRTRQLPVQVHQLPVLGAYLVDQQTVPEGDGNAGEFVFVSTARIGFSVIIVNDDVNDTETVLDRAYMALMNSIWRDPYVTSFIDTHNPHQDEGSPLNARFESAPRQSRRNIYGSVGTTNETPIAELQYEVSLMHRSDYAPIISDELLEVDFKTAIGWPNHDQVQQVEMPMRFARPKSEEANG